MARHVEFEIKAPVRGTDGQVKFFRTVGKTLIDDTGRRTGVIDVLPTAFDGWILFEEPEGAERQARDRVYGRGADEGRR